MNKCQDFGLLVELNKTSCHIGLWVTAMDIFKVIF